MKAKPFIRFFDKQGNDMNLGATHSTVTSLYDSSESQYEFYMGKLFFPKISVNLIESQHLYVLQEVTGPTSSFQLRKIEGSVDVTAGNPNVYGTDFTEIQVGNYLKLGEYDYSVIAAGATYVQVSPTPSVSYQTQNAYLYDYLSYSQLRSSPGTFYEYLETSFEEEQDKFFFYSIDYSESVPFIEKSFQSTVDLEDGSGDSYDPLTDRISLNTVTTLPTSINLGFSCDDEDIFEEKASINDVKVYKEQLVSFPSFGGDYYTFVIGGTSHDFFEEITSFFLEGATSSSSLEPFYSQELKVVEVGTTGANTYIKTEIFDNPSVSSTYSNYRILWKNTYKLVDLDLYAETEAEDERLRVLLGNFGKKIDFDKEYIFRESDINEELPDFKILNKKRKELLLEGDNIYPYIGSYRSLINVINYFGYYDLRIKEYFLNVDSSSKNFGKYLHISVDKDPEVRAKEKAAWEIVPSGIYKKTSLFGLFYDLNRTTSEVDEHGIPEVEDAFDFTPEEVLIKLFGLKELLKKEFLPLNARIYDITGEGIYFERIRVSTWSDNLNHISLDIGKRPEFKTYPTTSYISDIRRIDDFYVKKFTEQGLTGFMGVTSVSYPLSADSYTSSLSLIKDNYLEKYDNFLESVYDSSGNYLPILDDSWSFMPPGISNPNFNQIASRLLPLPDDSSGPAGAPLLLEAFFNISWDESQFQWNDAGILGPTGNPVNITIWSWNSIGRGEYVDLRWTIEKKGENGFFYDTGRKSIEDFVVGATPSDRILHAVALPYSGDYQVGLYIYDITNNYTVEFKNHTVLNKNVDFVSIHRKETPERKWEEFTISWLEAVGPWYYPVYTKSSWEDAKVNWDSLSFDSVNSEDLYEYQLETEIYSIDREDESLTLKGDVISSLPSYISLQKGDFLFLTRDDSEYVQESLEVPIDGFSFRAKGLSGTGEFDALFSGSYGSTSVSSGIYDTTDYIFVNDHLWIDGYWYTVKGVTTSNIEVEPPLYTSFSGVNALRISSDNTVEISYAGSLSSMKRYSRILVSDNCFSEEIDPTQDLCYYLDGLTASSQIKAQGDLHQLKELVFENSSLGGNKKMYLTWGAFSGTYAIEINNVILQGNNTKIRLNDVNRELYNIDGNYVVKFAEYDVDYAETKIGVNSLSFENLSDVSWEDNNNSWYSTEYHSDSLCGFVIPFVAPGGDVTIDENETFVFSGDVSIGNSYSGKVAAAAELNSSTNESISKFDYTVHPEETLFIHDSSDVHITFNNNESPGSTTLTLTVPPDGGDLKIPAQLEVVLTGGSVTAVNILNSGYGYRSVPKVTVTPVDCVGVTAATITCVMSGSPLAQYVSSVSFTPGAGYSETPVVEVEQPENYRPYDNIVWTGREWVEIESVTGNTLFLKEPLKLHVNGGDAPLLPYQYHKQLFLNKELFNEFYYFIQAKAKTPGLDMLSYVNFSNGVESEWRDHPERTYTYPLRNSLYQASTSEDLTEDHLYQKWKYEGSDYPPVEIFKEFSSGVLSKESRLPFSMDLSSPYTFLDSFISNSQVTVQKSTPVLFNYDTCRVPGKRNPVWTIYDEDHDTVEAISTSKSLFWNFTKPGNYSVSLFIEDKNGNKVFGKKNSFLVVK